MCFLHVACLCAPDCVTHILPANSYYDCLCQNSLLLSPGQENPNDAHVNLYWATCASSRSHPQQNMWTNGTNDGHPTVNGQNTWNSWGSSYCKRLNGKYETTKDDWIYSLLYLKPKHLQASTRQGTHVMSKKTHDPYSAPPQERRASTIIWFTNPCPKSTKETNIPMFCFLIPINLAVCW